MTTPKQIKAVILSESTQASFRSRRTERVLCVQSECGVDFTVPGSLVPDETEPGDTVLLTGALFRRKEQVA